MVGRDNLNTADRGLASFLGMLLLLGLLLLDIHVSILKTVFTAIHVQSSLWAIWVLEVDTIFDILKRSHAFLASCSIQAATSSSLHVAVTENDAYHLKPHRSADGSSQGRVNSSPRCVWIAYWGNWPDLGLVHPFVSSQRFLIQWTMTPGKSKERKDLTGWIGAIRCLLFFEAWIFHNDCLSVFRDKLTSQSRTYAYANFPRGHDETHVDVNSSDWIVLLFSQHPVWTNDQAKSSRYQW